MLSNTALDGDGVAGAPVDGKGVDSAAMDPLTLGLAGAGGVAFLVWLMVLLRNRAFTDEVPVFRASRFSRGHRIFPTQVAVFPTRVVRYTPRWFGHLEETIGIEQVASVSLDAGLLFAHVIIETAGGSQPIRCYGHYKGDAQEIRQRISEAQATARA